MLVNKDITTGGSVRLTGLTSGKLVAVTYLSAAAVDVKTGLTRAGQTFDATPDGKPVGTQACTAAQGNSQGDYIINVDPAQVALMVVPAQK